VDVEAYELRDFNPLYEQLAGTLESPPRPFVDALFSGDGDTLNIEDALSELSKERGDIVRVDDGETKVRIWIDERD